MTCLILFKFKIGCKAGETTCNINHTLSPGTSNKSTVQWGFKKFCKGEGRLEVEKHSGQPSEVDNNQLRQIGKLKRLDKWVPHGLTVNKRSHHFKVSSSLILHNNNERFLHGIAMCDEKNSKALPKGKLMPKKVMVTVWWSASHLVHYGFLNPSKTITSEKHAQQIDEMHQKLMGPILHDNTRPHITQAMLQKLNKMGYEVSPHPSYLPNLLPTNYHIFKQINNFLQGKCFYNQQEAENTFQEFTESQIMGFYTTGINKLMSCWQKFVDCNGSYFD
ncbi:hypothetical protein FD755_011886 [Muntiacus reevesi]|uniref:Histone-lysine N-methyltransferase SETMAR n=1 Tax=Muntiacus reevesi TaxID=9886 RepID=A0A5N3XUD4_MUNRE|nr:hypothetical protein FD755_011886 [Muntiacus reevesi]